MKTDLRTWLNAVEAHGELKTVDGADWEHRVGPAQVVDPTTQDFRTRVAEALSRRFFALKCTVQEISSSLASRRYRCYLTFAGLGLYFLINLPDAQI